MKDTDHPGSWGDPSNPNVEVQSLIGPTNVVSYEEYLNHLQDAERSLSKALDCLYKHDGVRRGIGYRIRLGNAQNIAMTLLVREINHKEGYKSGGAHEWEVVGNEWECIYCEQRTKPKQMGPRLVFGPNVLRRVPFYGRKWRCHG
jgi:hypothetical protein